MSRSVTLRIREARGSRYKKQFVRLAHSTDKIMKYALCSKYFRLVRSIREYSRSFSLRRSRLLKRSFVGARFRTWKKERGFSHECCCAFEELHLPGIRTIKLKSRYADKLGSRKPFRIANRTSAPAGAFNDVCSRACVNGLINSLSSAENSNSPRGELKVNIVLGISLLIY